jgi:hypothetical protein
MTKQKPTPFFLFLGDTDREGPASKLKAAGIEYIKKRLESGLENWNEIFKLLESEEITGALVKLSRTTYDLMAQPAYTEAVTRLFSLLQRIPHIVFVHESFLTGLSDKAPAPDAPEEDHYWYTSYFEPPRAEIREHVHRLFDQYDLQVIPYRRNAELSVMASSFIDQNDKNLIFRLYVPAERMWASEAEKLLNLFRDYLARVSGLNVRQDQYRTNQGVVYEFFGDRALDPAALPKEFEDFSRLLDLCIVSPDAATQILEKRSIEPSAIRDIVERYGKEAKRLHVDLKHERERRVLSIRHRMESELIDVVGPDADWQSINQLVEASVPQVHGVTSAIGFSPAAPPELPSSRSIININPQIINTVQGVVAQQISGNQSFGLEANQLLDLISQHGGTHKAELTSAVYELEDRNAKPADRLSARQKLKRFVYKVADKCGDVAVGVLQKYIEGQLGL